jgi:hypothetical protein
MADDWLIFCFEGDVDTVSFASQDDASRYLEAPEVEAGEWTCFDIEGQVFEPTLDIVTPWVVRIRPTGRYDSVLFRQKLIHYIGRLPQQLLEENRLTRAGELDIRELALRVDMLARA